MEIYRTRGKISTFSTMENNLVASEKGKWIAYRTSDKVIFSTLERCIYDEELLGKALIVYPRGSKKGARSPLFFLISREYYDQVLKDYT